MAYRLSEHDRPRRRIHSNPCLPARLIRPSASFVGWEAVRLRASTATADPRAPLHYGTLRRNVLSKTYSPSGTHTPKLDVVSKLKWIPP